MGNGRITIIGNLVMDKILLNDKRVDTSPGGTAFYAGMALAKLGADVELISKIGADYPKRFLIVLREAGIDLDSVSRVESQYSTSFQLHYSNDLLDREVTLSCPGPIITPRDIPDSINESECVHVGIVAGEMDPEVLALLDPDSIGLIGADLHLLREISEGGIVTLGRGEEFQPFFHKIDVIKGSLDEIAALAGTDDTREALRNIALLGPRIVFATDGANGSMLYTEGEFYKIPAFQVEEVDTTGAGDVFLSSFLFFHGVMDDDIVESAYLASAAASFVVEGEGPKNLGDAEEVRERAALIRRKPTTPIPETLTWESFRFQPSQVPRTEGMEIPYDESPVVRETTNDSYPELDLSPPHIRQENRSGETGNYTDDKGNHDTDDNEIIEHST